MCFLVSFGQEINPTIVTRGNMLSSLFLFVYKTGILCSD